MSNLTCLLSGHDWTYHNYQNTTVRICEKCSKEEDIYLKPSHDNPIRKLLHYILQAILQTFKRLNCKFKGHNWIDPWTVYDQTLYRCSKCSKIKWRKKK